MPMNTVYVGRPTQWGNPFSIKDHGREKALQLYREWLRDKAILVFDDLRGQNLACWCPLPKPGEPDLCHAAVLLKIANADWE